jgi:hypothetical protein
LDEVIDEIRGLMIRSQETSFKENLSRRETARATPKQKQQQQQRDGAERQLRRVVWDLGGFQ